LDFVRLLYLSLFELSLDITPVTFGALSGHHMYIFSRSRSRVRKTFSRSRILESVSLTPKVSSTNHPVNDERHNYIFNLLRIRKYKCRRDWLSVIFYLSVLVTRIGCLYSYIENIEIDKMLNSCRMILNTYGHNLHHTFTSVCKR